jgi:hypothetical protein
MAIPSQKFLSSAQVIFGFRLASACGSSAIFGLIATSQAGAISLASALLAGFLFGTAFVGGTGYRIIRSVLANAQVSSPASWSGAAAASALACLVALPFWLWTGNDASRLLLAYALAINFAYLAVKIACSLAGCCHADIRAFGRVWGLRRVEIGLTLAIFASAALLCLMDVWLGAMIGLVGHTLLRLYSRAQRGRPSTGWPPLRQPGAELAPLQALCFIALFGALGIFP